MESSYRVLGLMGPAPFQQQMDLIRIGFMGPAPFQKQTIFLANTARDHSQKGCEGTVTALDHSQEADLKGLRLGFRGVGFKVNVRVSK